MPDLGNVRASEWQALCTTSPKKGELYACEFASGNLFRSIHLPKKIDADKVKAEFKNGMLRLKAPVAAEARAKKITVEAA